MDLRTEATDVSQMVVPRTIGVPAVANGPDVAQTMGPADLRHRRPILFKLMTHGRSS